MMRALRDQKCARSISIDLAQLMEMRKVLLPDAMMASGSSCSDEPEPGPAESDYMGFDLFR